MMRLTIVLVLLLLSTASFALTDLGLNNSAKTAGYYLMPSVDGGGLSSGFVYSSRLNDRSKIEAIFTAYKSAYLLTKNVSQLIVFDNYQLLGFGPLGLSGLLGLGVMYSPAVGGGLTGAVGGTASLQLMENLKVGVPAYFSVFNDGFMLTFSPTVNFNPGFLPRTSLFGGARIDMSIVDPAASASNFSGKFNMYGVFGLRTAL